MCIGKTPLDCGPSLPPNLLSGTDTKTSPPRTRDDIHCYGGWGRDVRVETVLRGVLD